MEQNEQAALLAQNTEFMARCAARKLDEKDPAIVGSPWVAKLPLDEKKELFDLIFNYDSWTEETDPTGTHAAGVVQYKGHYICWVIRDYNPNESFMLELEPRMVRCLMVRHSSEI
jgi:hypothetical protein